MIEKDGVDPQYPKIEPLGKKHDRVVFSCGDDALDTYLKKRASQEAKKNIATTFVMTDSQSSAVIGYYTLSATSILLADLPDETARRLPKYPQVPATLLGRLAIDLLLILVRYANPFLIFAAKISSAKDGRIGKRFINSAAGKRQRPLIQGFQFFPITL